MNILWIFPLSDRVSNFMIIPIKYLATYKIHERIESKIILQCNHYITYLLVTGVSNLKSFIRFPNNK